jgi:DNA-binding response OmpR family regulator
VSRIFIIEDDPHIADLMVRAFRGEGFETEVAVDGLAAWSQLQERRPDAVLIDLELPGLDGMEICRRLRNDPVNQDVAILIVSGRGEVADRLTALEIGADDYIVKPFDIREVTARVHSVLRRLRQPPPLPRRIGRLELDLDASAVTLDGKPIDLTAREHDLFAALVRAHGRVVRRATLLRDAWGFEHVHEVGSRTLDVHVTRLRQKLGPEAERLVTVKGVGYRFDISGG